MQLAATTPAPKQSKADTKAQLRADKRIPILAVAAALGIQVCTQARGGNYYCRTFFREENTASLVLCEPKNVWIDFGQLNSAGKPTGGDVLALVQCYYEAQGVRLTVGQARQLLRQLAEQILPGASYQELTAPRQFGAASTSSMAFTEVDPRPLNNQVLISYLVSRGINWSLVSSNNQTLSYLQQITYQIVGKFRPRPYFALAWRTNAGYELRAKNFQNCLGGKSLTVIPGPVAGVAVFEGFMDYLSALTYYKKSKLGYTVVVLNQAQQIGNALPYLEDAPQVHWFGDNDAAGEKALAFLRDALPPGRITTHNEIYREYKDFNDFLTKTPPTKPLPLHRAAPSERSKTAKWWLYVVFDRLDLAKSRKTGRQEYRQCTFYSWSNDEAGYDRLIGLRHQLQGEIRYHSLCERTTGRDYRVLASDGLADERTRKPRAAPAPALPASNSIHPTG